MKKRESAEEIWRGYLEGTHPSLKRERRFLRLLPSAPRCKLCNSPFGPPGSLLVGLIGKRRSPKNPNYCNMCYMPLLRRQGGAEVQLTLLFADVRGSTTLAERMSPSEFSRVLNRFYDVANHILIDTDAPVDKLVGDEVIGLYLPYLKDHPHKAVRAAWALLHGTGHADAGGPWLPIGAGVHTGIAYVGTVGTEDTVLDLTALGDSVNVAARLASLAGPGEALVSESTYLALQRTPGDGAALLPDAGEQRELTLKGRSEPIRVRVLRAIAPAGVAS